MADVKPRRIAFVVADPGTAKVFLAGHMRALSERYRVALVANTADAGYLRALGVDGDTFPVRIERSIRPLRDLRALFSLIRLFRRMRFDAVHSVTPKAGLLAMMAARIAGVPLRTHTFTGQVWATQRGFRRRALRLLDKINHRLSTFSLVDSISQRDFLLDERVVRPERSGVLAEGSICGVDAGRFRPDAGKRAEVREALELEERQILFLFVGRLKREKGVLDLARAFAAVHARHETARLLIVGPEDEAGLRERISEALGPHLAACTLIDWTDRPEDYLAAADIFCLPSYREGFGSVLVEAGAAALPSIASKIYGIDDAVVDGVTGLLHPAGDADAIAERMEMLILAPQLRAQMGEAGRKRAIERFGAARVVQAMADYYAVRLPPG